MNKTEIFAKITEKKDFSELPKKDIEKAFEHFEKRECSDEDKIKLTRDLLRKVFSAFASHKILSLKNKDEEWILRKHLSTRERLAYYDKVYSRIFNGLGKKLGVFDLGSGINGFSYSYFKKLSFNVKYTAVESMGQLVDLMNFYFKNKKLNAKAIHESLFELEKIKKLIKSEKGEKVIFLFKVIDSLEMLERDYSKRLLQEIAPLVDKVVVSFATRSMIKREKFKINRNWIIGFIRENFEVFDDFELGNERYFIFSKK